MNRNQERCLLANIFWAPIKLQDLHMICTRPAVQWQRVEGVQLVRKPIINYRFELKRNHPRNYKTNKSTMITPNTRILRARLKSTAKRGIPDFPLQVPPLCTYCLHGLWKNNLKSAYRLSMHWSGYICTLMVYTSTAWRINCYNVLIVLSHLSPFSQRNRTWSTWHWSYWRQTPRSTDLGLWTKATFDLRGSMWHPNVRQVTGRNRDLSSSFELCELVWLVCVYDDVCTVSIS